MQVAWNSNKKFTANEAREFKAVRSEITTSLVEELFTIFGTTTTPSQHVIKDILVHVHQEKNIKLELIIYLNLKSIKADNQGFLTLALYFC